jgi:hypothetical protein
VVSTADADLFDKPKNDAGGDDGFQRLTLEFDDFQPGETLTFGSDGDPTSIKGADNDVQNTLAGPVSGAELSGITVTVTFADGTSETIRTFGDGSAGGSAVVSTADQSTQPTLGVQNVSLDGSALDARHSAAYVNETQQTLTVSGPAGATVQVIQADTELNLEGVPEYDGTPGYNVEEFEGNNFVSVTYQTVELGSDGQATVDVTLPDDPEQPVYFMAAVENADGSIGEPSNVVVLQHSLTVAEAVASQDGDDTAINLTEIQTAINWWATDSEVPNTGGQTISLQQIQQLINIWATGATVGEADQTQSLTSEVVEP